MKTGDVGVVNAGDQYWVKNIGITELAIHGDCRATRMTL